MTDTIHCFPLASLTLYNSCRPYSFFSFFTVPISALLSFLLLLCHCWCLFCFGFFFFSFLWGFFTWIPYRPSQRVHSFFLFYVNVRGSHYVNARGPHYVNARSSHYNWSCEMILDVIKVHGLGLPIFNDLLLKVALFSSHGLWKIRNGITARYRFNLWAYTCTLKNCAMNYQMKL